jgi:hypothetical protein
MCLYTDSTMRITAAVVLCASLLHGRMVAQVPEDRLQTLYQGHRWFELRDEVIKRGTKGFYKAASEAVFNKPEAERDLREVIAKGREKPQLISEARCQLSWLYSRTGRFEQASEVVRLPEDSACWDPQSSGLRKVGPAQTASRQPGENVIHVEFDSGRLYIPATLNGLKVDFALDIGTRLCLISRTYAEALKFGTAEAISIKSVDIGDLHVENVDFAVVPDDTPVLNTPQRTVHGIIGLPVILSLGRFSWKPKQNTLTLLTPSDSKKPKANLAFDQSHVVNQAYFRETPIRLFVDTGTWQTQLFSSFLVPDDLKSGEIHCPDGRGGTTPCMSRKLTLRGWSTFPVMVLPSLSLNIGGGLLEMHPAFVNEKDPDSEGDDIYSHFNGMLGIDLLGQADAVDFDFNAMTMTLSVSSEKKTGKKK